MSQHDSVRASFARRGQSLADEVLLEKFVGISIAHQLTPDQLANQWESFLVSNKFDQPSHKAFDKFKVAMQPLSRVKTPHKADLVTRQDLDDPNQTPMAGGRLTASIFASYGLAAPLKVEDSSANVVRRLSTALSDTTATAVDKKPRVKTEPAAGDVKHNVSASVMPSNNVVPSAEMVSDDTYKKRAGSGKVVVEYNEQLAQVSISGLSSDVKKTITVEADANCALKPYGYMWDQLPARAQAFRARVTRLTHALLDKHEAALGGEPGTFHLPCTTEVLCVGKLCGEQDKLDDQHQLYLEGVSPENDTVHRIKVDLSRMTDFCLFAGQVVAMRATNPNGSLLRVSQLWTDASLPLASTRSDLVFEQGTVKMTVAAGPFCTHQNLDYRPLDDLLSVACRNGTDVLVLMGPFVDARHPVIAEGTLLCTYEEKWDELLTRIVDRIVAHNSGSAVGKQVQKVVLVPSPLDMHHAAVFPQFPLAVDRVVRQSRERRELIMSVSNPALLRINGVLCGLSSADPLRVMHSSMYRRAAPSQGAPAPSLIEEAAARIIEQQSFVPVNPLPRNPATAGKADLSLPVDINLDATQLAATEFGDETPQILILPSVFPEFAKVVKGALVVNPSTLIRAGLGGGTYAELTLHPKLEESAINDQVPQPMEVDQGMDAEPAFNVLKQVGVRIVKI